MSDLDLRTLSLEADHTGQVEAFIADRLVAAGVWASARTSDGIAHLRVVERSQEISRVCGHIYTIDQDLHSFWLDLVRDTDPLQLRWALYFDLIEPSPRRQRNAILVHDRGDELDWKVALSGTAVVRDGVLVSESWSREP